MSTLTTPGDAQPKVNLLNTSHIELELGGMTQYLQLKVHASDTGEALQASGVLSGWDV